MKKILGSVLTFMPIYVVFIAIYLNNGAPAALELLGAFIVITFTVGMTGLGINMLYDDRRDH